MTRRTLPYLAMLGVLAALASSAAAEDAPPPWISYGEWQPVGISTSYYIPEILSDGRVGLWFDAHFQGHDAVINLSGPSLSQLERVAPRFDAQLIRGYDQELGNRATPVISRSSATRLRDGSVLVLASIGPAYDGGRSELYPALFHSVNGIDGWQHLGPPTGEPAAWLAEQRRSGQLIRCEGAGIVQLSDGRLRMYLQNLGARLAILEADQPAGPWRLLRDQQGRVRDALADLPGGWLFPHISPIGSQGYLLTGGNTWPPTAIIAAVSSDGLLFRPPAGAREPATIFKPQWLQPNAANAKTLRLAWDEDHQRLLAMTNVFDGNGWPLFWTSASIHATTLFRHHQVEPVE